MASQSAFKFGIIGVVLAICAVVVIFGNDGGPDERDFSDPALLQGTVIDEEAAQILFPCLTVRTTPRHLYDPVSILQLIPNKEVPHHWPEHGRGKLMLNTNNMGFREDQPTQVLKNGVRIIVTGDSHTEGFVWNDQSIANVLEYELNETVDGTPYEVINAGVGATNAYNHKGILEKSIELDPDIFICVLFTGNDFAGALTVADFFSKRIRSPNPEGYEESLTETMDKLGMGSKRWGRSIIGNGFQQAYRFKHHPEEPDIAFAATVTWYEEMNAICEARGIEFIAVVIPTKPDVDGDHDKVYTESILDRLGMNSGDYGMNRRLGKRFVEALEDRGMLVLDTTKVLRDHGDPLYWRKDYHLSDYGCRIVAKELFTIVQPMLAW